MYPLDLFTSLVQQHPSGTGRGEFQSPGKRKLHPGFLLLLWHNLRLPSAPRGDNLWFSFCTNEAPFVPMERTCRGWIQLIMWSSQDDNFTVGLQFVPLVILFLSSLGESGKQHREGYLSERCLCDIFGAQELITLRSFDGPSAKLKLVISKTFLLPGHMLVFPSG